MIKLNDGDYQPLGLNIGLDDILSMRAKIIRYTAEAYDPDVLLVDKEPLGLRGEVHDTLTMLKARGTPLVLGLRDVMDEPGQLAEEWERKNAAPALIDLYDAIWVYGLPQICSTLEGIALPDARVPRSSIPAICAVSRHGVIARRPRRCHSATILICWRQPAAVATARS